MKQEKTKQEKLKVVYKYLEPTSREERKEAERRLEKVYDICLRRCLRMKYVGDITNNRITSDYGLRSANKKLAY